MNPDHQPDASDGLDRTEEENSPVGMCVMGRRRFSRLFAAGALAFALRPLNALAGSATKESDKSTAPTKHELSPDSPEAGTLFAALEARFGREPVYYKRPRGVRFTDVKRALEVRSDLIYSLYRMEQTGGSPDVIAVTGRAFIFADVSPESPEGRRNLDYDEAKTMADDMGVSMMSRATYRKLQASGRLDEVTWSWLLTDAAVRRSRRALAGCRHKGQVRLTPFWFGYHGPGWGWRGVLKVPKVK